MNEEAKSEKAEALDNSRPLNMWRLSDYPEAKSAVDHIFNELLDAGLVSKRFRPKWRDLTRTLVLDLFVTHQTDPTMYIGYSRDPKRYKINSRYGAFFLSGTILVKIVDYLDENEYIDHHPGFNDPRTSKARLSRMRATSKLVNIVQDQHKVTVPMLKHNPDEQVIILRDADKNDIEYDDTRQIGEMRENLRLINANLENHAILLYITDEELKALQGRLNHKINFADRRVRRVFNNESWEQGGRFYGGWWQNVPREHRHLIRINDKDVVECDYSGLHINMLYATSSLPMPEGDVYHIPVYSNDGVFRDFVKKLLLVTVNSDNRDEARKALHSEVHFKKTLTLPPEIPSTSGQHLFPLMDAFEAKHKPIKHYFCTGVGIDLQNKDSHIAEKVLLRFSRMGYAILPMHDSFIIHHGLEEELKEAMNEAFKDSFGVSCKVDLKYNSINERNKHTEDQDDECWLSYHELMELEEPYSIYWGLLKEHRRLSRLPGQATGSFSLCLS